jgi:UDP-N-acetylmuramoyl-L-alanyl-D-glutamate--2,6-diaminopimelate ligase
VTRPPSSTDGSLRAVPFIPPTVRELAERHRLVLREDGSPDVDAQVSGLSLDSRRVGPGQLYAALPGGTTHGARFAVQAVEAGAVALLTDPEGAGTVAGLLAQRDLPVPPVLVADRPRVVLGPVAADVNGHPSEELALVGVTGTNGKTTVSTLVDELLRALGVRTGLIGTIRSRIGDEELASSFTTPEAPDLQHLLRRMVQAGCTAVSAEVSSHALAQHRVDGTRLAVAVFTNLSRDHLDFHGTLAAYFAAKLRLFTGGFARTAVVCVDDEWGAQVAVLAREAGLDVLTVGSRRSGGRSDGRSGDGSDGRPADEPADVTVDVTVEVLQVQPTGQQLVRVRGPLGDDGAQREVELRVGMPGPFNAVNAALALVTARALLLGPDAPVTSGRGPVDLDDVAAAFDGLPGVPGRMERVVAPGHDDRPLVVVDYAHTPDAVAAAVAALRAATPGRLVVVLGAGGDRDTGKRERMGEAASAADLVVVTDDNPRNEDPAAIRAAVLAGVTAPVVEVGDRADAVAAALAACDGPDDTVLLAGKGHETGQQVGGETLPFDDRDVAREALLRWQPSGVGA